MVAQKRGGNNQEKWSLGSLGVKRKYSTPPISSYDGTNFKKAK